METYERSDINGILDARGTDIEYCPTFILRRCLDAHNIPSLHLTRKQCVSKMRNLGYISLHDPHAIDPSMDTLKTIVSKSQYARSFANPMFENQDKTQSATRSATLLTFEQTQTPLVYRPTHPLYDASFNTVVCDQLHSLHNIYVNMKNITTLVNELDSKVKSIQDNLNQVNDTMFVSESEVSRGVFEYKEFSNINSPFINIHHGKGVFIPIERLIDNRLTFDYDTSYVHIREQQTMYDIIIEIQNLGWFDRLSVNFQQTRNIGIHLMDIKTFADIQNKFEFDPNENIITKFMNWNYSTLKWELWAKSPGARFNDGNVYIYTTLLDTVTNWPGLTTNSEFLSFRFHFTALKRVYANANVTNPFMTGLRKNKDVVFLSSNASSLSVRGFHQWVDSPDRVVLSTSIRVKHESVAMDIPALIQIELDVPHTTIEHGNVGYHPCPYTGAGLITNANARVDVRLDRNEDNTKSVMKIVLESKYIPLSREEIEISVDIGYSLETKNISYITPIVNMDYEMIDNMISITNMDVKDSVNLDGDLELNEYYNIVHTLTETHQYNKDINTIFVDYDVNQTYDGDTPQFSIQNIRLSNSNIEANEPQVLDFTYTFEMVIRDTTDVYTSVVFPDGYVQVDDYVLDVVDDHVFSRIRYEDFAPTLRVYEPADPDSIQVTVLQHVPETQTDSNIEYRVMDVDKIQTNVSSALHMLVPSTTYVRVRDVRQTVRFLTDNLVGFIYQEGSLQELGEFETIQITVSQS
jgi:hypothetical protein